MKKIITLVLVAVMILSSVAVVSAADKVTILVNGKKVEGECITKNGRTLAPVRAISEALGAKVYWDETTQMVTVSKIVDKKLRNVYMKIGNKFLSVNGTMSVDLDEPAQTVNGRTVIPVSALCVALGVNVLWDDKTQTVTISSAPTEIENAQNMDNVISDNLKQAEDKAVAMLEKQEAEAKAAGVLEANGYLCHVAVAPYLDIPSILIKLDNKTDSDLPACQMKLIITDKQTAQVEKEVFFNVEEFKNFSTGDSGYNEDTWQLYGEREIELTEKDVKLQYMDESKYNYDVRIIK